MSAIQIKNVPPEMHEALRRRAAEENMSVRDYVLEVLRRDLAFPSRREWLARIREMTPHPDIDVVAALDAARAEREEQLLEAWRCRSL